MHSTPLKVNLSVGKSSSLIPDFLDYLLTEVFCVPPSAKPLVSYGGERSSPALQIPRSAFFDDVLFSTPDCATEVTLPQLPGQTSGSGLDEIKFERDECGDLRLTTDIVAASFLLLTRYEEIIRRAVRDQHGRFEGKASWPVRANFIDRPLVDEFGRTVRSGLRALGADVPEPERQFKLTLTHDVDHPFKYNTPRKIARGIVKNLCRQAAPWRPVASALGLSDDPFRASFDWIRKQNDLAIESIKNVQEIYFFMASTRGPHDGNYRIQSPRVRTLIRQLQEHDATIGLHPSYAAGADPAKIAYEKSMLEAAADQAITSSRHHYLRFREPEHFSYLVDAGITDDYTAGYADRPGFRCGTSHPCHYFDPAAGGCSTLTIHPLQLMDVSFQSSQYMNLSVDEALAHATPIIDNTIAHGGELVLLFHNNLFVGPTGEYHRQFYPNLIQLIADRLSSAS